MKKSVEEMKETIKTDKKELKDKVCAISHQVDTIKDPQLLVSFDFRF